MWEGSSLKHSATNRKVSSSFLDVIGFFNLLAPFCCTTVLGLTQPLRETSTGNLPEDKEGTTHKADNVTVFCVQKCESLNISEPYGPQRHVTRIALLLFYYTNFCCMLSLVGGSDKVGLRI
jgi:hypothetical protein